MSTETTKQNKCGEWDLQIINAGFPRCGTSSLSSALDILGFGPTWHCETNNTFFSEKHYKFFQDKLYAIKNGEYVDYDEFFQKTGIMTAMDAPFIAIWKELSQFYPNAKIIVCVRNDYEKWQQSLSQTVQWLIRGKTLTVLGYYFSFISIFRKEFCPILNQEWLQELNTKNKYQQRIQDIKDFINDDERLLILNITTIKKDGQESWKPLCEFLNVPIPTQPYPFNNYKGKMMKRAIIGLMQLFFGYILLPILLSIAIYWYILQ